MKVGDKLLCKEYYTIGNFFEKGKYYNIVEVYNNRITLLDENNNECSLYIIKLHGIFDDLILWNFFYTQSELRKMKLKKINKYGKKSCFWSRRI